MTIVFVEGRCHPNKTALQLYVPKDAATESEFPFGPEDAYRGMTVPGTSAVLVWPRGEHPAFPVEVEYPAEQVPWPLADAREPTRR